VRRSAAEPAPRVRRVVRPDLREASREPPPRRLECPRQWQPRVYALHRIERLLTIDRYRVTIAAQPLLPFYAAAAPLTIGLKATDADRAPLSKREHGRRRKRKEEGTKSNAATRAVEEERNVTNDRTTRCAVTATEHDHPFQSRAERHPSASSPSAVDRSVRHGRDPPIGVGVHKHRWSGGSRSSRRGTCQCHRLPPRRPSALP